MTLTILLSSLLFFVKDITNIDFVVSATIKVGIPANLIPTLKFNTSFPNILIIKGYLKFYD